MLRLAGILEHFLSAYIMTGPSKIYFHKDDLHVAQLHGLCLSCLQIGHVIKKKKNPQQQKVLLFFFYFFSTSHGHSDYLPLLQCGIGSKYFARGGSLIFAIIT